ncbi:MAG: radical SAM protein [Planctomycetes bacterium]|nr:radical SAM protein [Planctomycetota bacterium]
MRNNIAEDISIKWNEENQALKSPVALMPRLLMLEVTNACNLKCTMCQNINMKRSKGFMSPELGKRAIIEAAQLGIREVALFTTGEPLLYKHLDELIIEAKNQNLYCYLSSNGLLLNKTTAEMLCTKGLDSFKFSIDASSKQEYESIRINGSFDKLINNVLLLKETRDKLQSPLKILCAAIAINTDQKRIEDFQKLFGPLCDSVLISECSNLGGKVNKDKTLNKKAGNTKKPPCRLLWDRIIICYNGKVTACCVDFDEELVYADYTATSLEKAWNNKTIQKWRNMHLTEGTCSMPMCGECNYPFLSEADELRNLNK